MTQRGLSPRLLASPIAASRLSTSRLNAVGPHIDEDRRGAGKHHHLDRGDEGEGRHEHRIARADALGHQRQQQGVGAVGAS